MGGADQLRTLRGRGLFWQIITAKPFRSYGRLEADLNLK